MLSFIYFPLKTIIKKEHNINRTKIYKINKTHTILTFLINVNVVHLHKKLS